MRGSFGIVGEYDEKKAKTGLAKLSHRGRDNCGIVCNKNLFFAHHRLGVQNISENSNQPFKYKNILLSFNGEIYNFKELRKDLQDSFEFKS